ncbi:MAG TPA: zf-HC2 domain-containing protein, partial [Pyrinomonadaceae bacterium]|nr:zf-HC2 domain-containing protein [Pyrinomonadaceae bacterium]
MTNCENIRERLTLYLDNELQGDERATVEAHVESCNSCASFVEKELTFLNAVRKSGRPHVASPELKASVAEILSGAKQPVVRSRRLRWMLPVAAALLVLLLPVVIWRVVREEDHPENGVPSAFAAKAAESHLRHVRGQLPLEVESSEPEKISAWFANKVNFNVKLPSYQESSGQEILYTLEGARLVNYQNDYAAYVSYHMKDRPISLVITSELLAQPSGGEEIKSQGLMFHYNAIDGLKVITWSDRGLTYALVSDLEERGQQSCIVCHQGTKDQDFIEP